MFSSFSSYLLISFQLLNIFKQSETLRLKCWVKEKLQRSENMNYLPIYPILKEVH